MIKFLLLTIFITTAYLANGQTVIVNPDGTHSIAIGGQEGSPTIIVNPNGTHTVVHKAGAHSIAVGPDGRHTVIVGTDQPGSPKIIVHPDGKHSIIHPAGSNIVMISPHGLHTVLANHLLLFPENNTTLSQRQLSIIWILALSLCVGY